MLSVLDARDKTDSLAGPRNILNYFTMALALLTVVADAIRSGFGYDAVPHIEAEKF